MNILMLNYEFPPLGGGGGIFTLDLATEFAKNHHVDIVTTHFQGLKKEEKLNGFTIYRVPVTGRTSLHSATMPSMLSFPVSGLFKALSLMRKIKYDVINTHFAVPTGPCGLALSFLSELPDVVSIHGSDIYNPVKKFSPHRHAIFRWAVRRVLNNAAKVISQSSYLKERAEDMYSLNKTVDVIPLGIPEPVFIEVSRPALGMDNERFCLISTGRLAKEKGFEYLIKAVGILKDTGIEVNLIILGDGPEKDSLEGLAHKLGLQDQISFPGWISGEKKFQYLKASDIFVLSSAQEGFGVVLLEALACGLPVVSTNQGGQIDVIKDPENGILIPPYSAESIASAVTNLYNRKNDLAGIGSNNMKDFKSFNISSISDKYLEAFETVI